MITTPFLENDIPALSHEGVLYFGDGSSQTAFFLFAILFFLIAVFSR